MRSGISYVVLALLVVVLSVGASGAAHRQEAKTLTVSSAELTGVVAEASGKTLSDVTLRIRKGEELIAETCSDELGKFAFENLPAGSCVLLVGTQRALPLSVSAEAGAKSLQVVIPQKRPYRAAALTETQWIWVGAGTGAAAVAVPVLGSEFDWFESSHHRGTVSEEEEVE